MIVNKPAGQLSQSGKSFEPDVVSEVKNYLKKCGEQPYAAIINRLDRPVGGLVLLAKNKKEAARLSECMQKNTLNKQYEALVCGKMSDDRGTLVDFVCRDGRDNISFVVPANGQPLCEKGKRAELTYEVVAYNDIKDISLLRIHLLTGRHHQIRVQFSSRGCPIAGDQKYGGDQALHAAEVLGLKRNTIALYAVGIEVDGRAYTADSGFYTSLFS